MCRKEEIAEVVAERTALSFTELKQETGLENGVLQYYIRESCEIYKREGPVVHKEKCQDCRLRSFCRERCVQTT